MTLENLEDDDCGKALDAFCRLEKHESLSDLKIDLRINEGDSILEIIRCKQNLFAITRGEGNLSCSVTQIILDTSFLLILDLKESELNDAIRRAWDDDFRKSNEMLESLQIKHNDANIVDRHNTDELVFTNISEDDVEEVLLPSAKLCGMLNNLNAENITQVDNFISEDENIEIPPINMFTGWKIDNSSSQSTTETPYIPSFFLHERRQSFEIDLPNSSILLPSPPTAAVLAQPSDSNNHDVKPPSPPESSLQLSFNPSSEARYEHLDDVATKNDGIGTNGQRWLAAGDIGVDDDDDDDLVYPNVNYHIHIPIESMNIGFGKKPSIRTDADLFLEQYLRQISSGDTDALSDDHPSSGTDSYEGFSAGQAEGGNRETPSLRRRTDTTMTEELLVEDDDLLTEATVDGSDLNLIIESSPALQESDFPERAWKILTENPRSSSTDGHAVGEKFTDDIEEFSTIE